MSKVQEQSEGVRILRRVVEGRLRSPLLLVGDEGVGRRLSVLEAARESFAQDDPNSFHSLQLDHGTHPDLVCLFPEKAVIGVEAVRTIVDQAYSFPNSAPARYVVIDGADQMTREASNALLKTLEEPPSTTRFFLLAQSVDNVLITIRSRCSQVRYRPLSEAFIVAKLRSVEPDPTKALVYARLADGSVGRAIQFRFTNCLGLRNKMLALLKIGLSGDIATLFPAVDDLKKEMELALRFLDHLLHDLVMLNHDPSLISNLDIIEELRRLGEQLGDSRVYRILDEVRQVRSRMKTKIDLSFHVKSALLSAFAA